MKKTKKNSKSFDRGLDLNEILGTASRCLDCGYITQRDEKGACENCGHMEGEVIFRPSGLVCFAPPPRTVEKKVKDLRPGDVVVNLDTGHELLVIGFPRGCRAKGYVYINTNEVANPINTRGDNLVSVVVKKK